MDKIVIICNDPESYNHLNDLVKLLFPECEISVIPGEGMEKFNMKEK